MFADNFFSEDNFKFICDELARRDGDLKTVLDNFGYPPCWKRPTGFDTLVYIILEQQVSLASARAAYLKLREKISPISPGKLLLLSDEDLKSCYLSRQKINYVRNLATAVISNGLDLDAFTLMSNEAIRTALVQIKGIGNWTVDVYLMMAMQRSDLFPPGDIALMKSIRAIKQLQPGISKEEVLILSSAWKPYRTIAAYILWHAYLSNSKKNLSIKKWV